MSDFAHGMRSTRTYHIWRSMKARCTNPKTRTYPRYGGRGIKVCDAWLSSFVVFIADMGESPAGLTLDRIDNDGHYEPGNCRWATQQEQQRNRSSNLVLDLCGCRMCAIEWAELMGYEKSLLVDRVTKRGWSAARAILTPPRDNKAPRKGAPGPDYRAALTQLAFMARASGKPTPELLRACEGAEALIANGGPQ